MAAVHTGRIIRRGFARSKFAQCRSALEAHRVAGLGLPTTKKNSPLIDGGSDRWEKRPCASQPHCVLLSCLLTASLFPRRHRKRPERRRADRPGHLGRGRRDGRRAGQRQEGHHHDHGRERCAGPLQLPRQQACARPVHAEHPRDRLRPRQFQDRRGRAADHHPQFDAAQDRGSRRADVERRMDAQHPRHRPAEGHPAGLRGLSHARARHALGARRRHLHEGHAAAHAGLRQSEHRAEPANAARRAADGGARRPARPDLPQRGRISGLDQSQQERAVEFRSEDAAASQGPRNPGDLHRIRPAARHHLAA